MSERLQFLDEELNKDFLAFEKYANFCEDYQKYINENAFASKFMISQEYAFFYYKLRKAYTEFNIEDERFFRHFLETMEVAVIDNEGF